MAENTSGISSVFAPNIANVRPYTRPNMQPLGAPQPYNPQAVVSSDSISRIMRDANRYYDYAGGWASGRGTTSPSAYMDNRTHALQYETNTNPNNTLGKMIVGGVPGDMAGIFRTMDPIGLTTMAASALFGATPVGTTAKRIVKGFGAGALGGATGDLAQQYAALHGGGQAEIHPESTLVSAALGGAIGGISGGVFGSDHPKLNLDEPSADKPAPLLLPPPQPKLPAPVIPEAPPQRMDGVAPPYPYHLDEAPKQLPSLVGLPHPPRGAMPLQQGQLELDLRGGGGTPSGTFVPSNVGMAQDRGRVHAPGPLPAQGELDLGVSGGDLPGRVGMPGPSVPPTLPGTSRPGGRTPPSAPTLPAPNTPSGESAGPSVPAATARPSRPAGTPTQLDLPMAWEPLDAPEPKPEAEPKPKSKEGEDENWLVEGRPLANEYEYLSEGPTKTKAELDKEYGKDSWNRELYIEYEAKDTHPTWDLEDRLRYAMSNRNSTTSRLVQALADQGRVLSRKERDAARDATYWHIRKKPSNHEELNARIHEARYYLQLIHDRAQVTKFDSPSTKTRTKTDPYQYEPIGNGSIALSPYRLDKNFGKGNTKERTLFVENEADDTHPNWTLRDRRAFFLHNKNSVRAKLEAALQTEKAQQALTAKEIESAQAVLRTDKLHSTKALNTRIRDARYYLYLIESEKKSNPIKPGNSTYAEDIRQNTNLLTVAERRSRGHRNLLDLTDPDWKTRLKDHFNRQRTNLSLTRQMNEAEAPKDVWDGLDHVLDMLEYYTERQAAANIQAGNKSMVMPVFERYEPMYDSGVVGEHTHITGETIIRYRQSDNGVVNAIDTMIHELVHSSFKQLIPKTLYNRYVKWLKQQLKESGTEDFLGEGAFLSMPSDAKKLWSQIFKDAPEVAKGSKFTSSNVFDNLEEVAANLVSIYEIALMHGEHQAKIPGIIQRVIKALHNGWRALTKRILKGESTGDQSIPPSDALALDPEGYQALIDSMPDVIKELHAYVVHSGKAKRRKPMRGRDESMHWTDTSEGAENKVDFKRVAPPGTGRKAAAAGGLSGPNRTLAEQALAKAREFGETSKAGSFYRALITSKRSAVKMIYNEIKQSGLNRLKNVTDKETQKAINTALTDLEWIQRNVVGDPGSGTYGRVPFENVVRQESYAWTNRFYRALNALPEKTSRVRVRDMLAGEHVANATPAEKQAAKALRNHLDAFAKKYNISPQKNFFPRVIDTDTLQTPKQKADFVTRVTKLHHLAIQRHGGFALPTRFGDRNATLETTIMTRDTARKYFQNMSSREQRQVYFNVMQHRAPQRMAVADMFNNIAKELHREALASERTKLPMSERHAKGMLRSVLNPEFNGKLDQVRTGDNFGPAGHLRLRTLIPEADRELKAFYLTDPGETLRDYAMGVIRNHTVRHTIIPVGVNRFRKATRTLIDQQVMDTKQRDLLDDLLGAAMGLEIPKDTDGARVVNTVQTYGAIMLLARSIIPSLAEPLVVGLRNPGSFIERMGAAGKAMADTLRYVATLDKNNHPDFMMGQWLGIITDSAVDTYVQDRMSLSTDSPAQQRLLSRFFSVTLQHGYSTASKLAALNAGISSMDRLGAMPQSKAWLAEIGIKDWKSAVKELADLSGGNLNRPLRSMLLAAGEEGYNTQIGKGLSLMVDQTIQAPTRADRPRYAEHGFGRLAYGIMSFMFAFHENILKASFKRAKGDAENFGGLGILGVASTLVAAQAIIAYVQDELTRSDTVAEEERSTAFDYLARGVQRSGLLGIMEPLISAYVGTSRYGGTPLETVAGAAPAAIFRDVGAIFKAIEGGSEATATTERNGVRAFYNGVVAPAVIYNMLGRLPNTPIFNLLSGAYIIGGTAPAVEKDIATRATRMFTEQPID